MVGACIAVLVVGTPHIPKRPTIAPRARAAFGCIVGRGTRALSESNVPYEWDQIVRTKWTTIGPGSPVQITAHMDPNDAFIDSDTDNCSHGVIDPSGHARGH